VHGTASSAVRWAELVNELQSDPLIWDRHQIWLYRYDSGNPIGFSAGVFRQALTETLQELDPEGRDPALQQMVVIGHSQGGLLTKLTAVDSGDRFWRNLSKKTFAEAKLDPDEREVLERSTFFTPLPFVKRVVFIATPHRGSYLTLQRVVRWVASLIEIPNGLSQLTYDFVTRNQEDLLIRQLDRAPTALDNSQSIVCLIREGAALMGRATASGEPSSNKREAVLAAAIRCFAARGLAGTGMRDIARASGLTEGTLYHYFPSKDALIDAAFQWSAFPASRVRDLMRRSDAPLRDRLLALGEEFLATLRGSPDWTRVVIRESLRRPSGGDTNPVRRALVSLATQRTRALVAVLESELTAGRIRACHPRLVADQLLHSLIGHWVVEAIAAAAPRAASGADPFLVRLVDWIAADLEPG